MRLQTIGFWVQKCSKAIFHQISTDFTKLILIHLFHVLVINFHNVWPRLIDTKPNARFGIQDIYNDRMTLYLRNKTSSNMA